MDNSNNNGDNHNAPSDLGFHSIRDRFPLKRAFGRVRTKPSPGDRPSARFRPMQHAGRFNRKALSFWVPFKGKVPGLYLVIIVVVFLFAMASMVMQSSMGVKLRLLNYGGSERGRSLREGLRGGARLRFVQPKWLVEGEGLERVRGKRRIGIRAPRLAVIIGKMKKDPHSLMLFTVMKNLKKLGYILKIYAVENGQAISLWEQIGGQPTILDHEQYSNIDWSIYEGVIVGSLEAEEAVTSLMQEPFCSVPIVWIIQEDSLANRLPVYENMGWEHLLSHWRNAFSRANVVVFPDFSLPMLYSVLDSGNFFVIPGTPVDVWAAESYMKTHLRDQLRKANGFGEDDMLVLVVGSSFFYNELSWDYAVAMHTIGPLLTKYARNQEAGESFKFVFLCGNSTDGYNDVLQEVAAHLGLPQGSLRHYGMNGDVNSVLMMADIVLYGSSQDELGFPPLLVRAMTFGVPFIAPDTPVMRKFVTDGVHGMFFPKLNPDALMKAFSLLISDGKLSRFGRAIASSGKLLAKNLLALETIKSYAKLLENVLIFPSDALLPDPVSNLDVEAWEWNLFTMELENAVVNMQSIDENGTPLRQDSIVYALEADFTDLVNSRRASENETDISNEDIPTELDWDAVREMENSEEYERVEVEELKERMEINPGNWDEIYRNARKSEKLRFELNERDEGELERTGQPICIYEIYSGSGAWPLLHHGSLYRGLSLSTKAQRLRSDDVNAVARLPVLNDTYYRDILCEIGGMFSIANKVDNIHKRPWIGFQSWRAAGRKVSLSSKAEKVLEEKIKEETHGDRIYFWVRLDMDNGLVGSGDRLTFWSMCDILNGGHCRAAFEDAFRRMYGLPPHIEALPPMPEDGGHWSALHSWVMPTPSFLEFIMFSRMFVDSLHASQSSSRKFSNCLLGSTEFEKKHCYCRVLDLLVNVWAYHSARKMVYINPHTGSLEEQHPINQRVGYMWAKYFNFTLLKSMDEDLAEAADDNDYPNETWLWPLTGEGHWQGIYEREREERYRLKMEKKRRTKEKLYERMKHGYQQKSLGG